MLDPSSKSPFCLALAQSPGELCGVSARLDWLRETLSTMSPADMLVLPECFANGYNIPDQLAESGEPSDGPIARSIAMLAQEHGIAIAYGFAEKSDGKLFNTAQVIGPDGALLHKYRKLALPPGFETSTYKAGTGAGLFQFRNLNIGMLICYDVEFPETVRHVATQGAHLVLVPTALGADWPWVADTLAPARAYENGVFLAYANHCGEEHGHRYYGHSVIAGPFGTEAARASDGETVIYAEIDPVQVADAQSRLPYFQDLKKLKLA